MSIAGSLSSALSGLTTAARAAEVISSNIANAQTPGYGRRELQTSARVIGGSGQGVQVTGVSRASNLIVIGDRRIAEAGTGDREARAGFFLRLERVIGTPDSATSLGSRIAAFDAAMIEASSRPDSEARLSRLADSARSLTSHIAKAATDIQAARTAADTRIGTEVGQLNTALGRIAELNSRILASSSSGRDASALFDQRQQVVDSIASIIPVREVPRDNGQIALMTVGGAILLDGPAQQLGFNSIGMVLPGMTEATGALSGLTINGRPVATAGENSLIAGGSLAAQFAIRDELAPKAQAQLDAVSRDLIERFSAPGLDPTAAPGAAGLFTDAGDAFLAANEIGLSQRLRLNAAADPAQGGAVWRLRDGLGAAAPGAVGDATLLNALQAALNAPKTPTSGGFTAGSRSFSALSADLLSGVASQRLTAENEASFSAAQTDALRGMELAEGVDTDQELQQLLLIEQSYAANARVVQTIDDMIQTLLSL